MEDGVDNTHSSPATYTTPEPTKSDSGHHPHPPPPTTANGGDAGEEPKEKDPEDQESVRESKRRKICPSAFEKCEVDFIKPCSNDSNCFSFSFDPKFSSGVSTPEVTPKFGSFKLVAAAGISTEIEEKSVEKSIEEKEEDDDDDEVKEKSNILEVLGSVDGLSAD